MELHEAPSVMVASGVMIVSGVMVTSGRDTGRLATQLSLEDRLIELRSSVKKRPSRPLFFQRAGLTWQRDQAALPRSATRLTYLTAFFA